MRCIQLFHPEFNMISKFAGKELMYNAKVAKVLETNQYGSRKHHKAMCACLNKVLFNNMLRINKNTGAMGYNDDKGSYNRINHTFAILEMMSFSLS